MDGEEVVCKGNGLETGIVIDVLGLAVVCEITFTVISSGGSDEVDGTEKSKRSILGPEIRVFHWAK